MIEGKHPKEEDSSEEIKGSGTALNEEQASKSEIDKVTLCSPLYHPCIQGHNHQKEEYLNFMVEDDKKRYPNL